MKHDVWIDRDHGWDIVEIQGSELFEVAAMRGACVSYRRDCASDWTTRATNWIASLNGENITILIVGGYGHLRVVDHGSDIGTSIGKLGEASECLGFYIPEYDGLFIVDLLDDELSEGI
jgi:hypothetical protein